MAEGKVVIVGAGPVGLTAALLLAEQDLQVVVLEAAPSLPDDMRASTFHPPTLDMLSRSGVADTLIAQGHRASKWQYYNRDTGERIVFDLGVLADLTGHPYRLQCEQFRLTRAIVDTLSRAENVAIRFGARVTSASQDTSTASVIAEMDGTEERFEGEFVIAADGGRSTMRALLDLAFRGETYPTTSITAVVDFPFESWIPDLLPVNYLWAGDEHFSLMRVQSQWRVGFSPAPGESLDQACDEGRVRERVRTFLGSDLNGQQFGLRHVGAYSVHRRIIDDFRVGRFLFAGDAAHLNSPAGGMGMNSGIHDARLLAESVGKVLRGGSDALLDQYSRRRRTIAIEDVQRQSDINHKRHRQKDPEARKAVWRELQDHAASEDSMRNFLRRTSLIASLEREAAIP